MLLSEATPLIQLLGHLGTDLRRHFHGKVVARAEARRSAVVPGHDVLQLAVPSQHLSDVLPVRIKDVGLREGAGIAVGRLHHHIHRLALGEQHFVALQDDHRLRLESRGELLHRAVQPHELVEIGRRVLPEHHHVVAVLKLALHALRGHVTRAQDPGKEPRL